MLTWLKRNWFPVSVEHVRDTSWVDDEDAAKGGGRPSTRIRYVNQKTGAFKSVYYWGGGYITLEQAKQWGMRPPFFKTHLP